MDRDFNCNLSGADPQNLIITYGSSSDQAAIFLSLKVNAHIIFSEVQLKKNLFFWFL